MKTLANSLKRFKVALPILVLMFFSGTNISGSYAQTYQTLGEIYDFDIGDEFHYRNIHYEGSYHPPDLIYDDCVNITIIDKYYSADSNTVFYKRIYQVSRVEWNGTWDTTKVDIVSYNGLGSTLRNLYGIWAFPDYSSPDYFHGRVLNTVSWPNGGNDGETHMTFVQGLGQVSKNNSHSGQQQHVLHEEKLVYYKKGSEVWGNPYYVPTYQTLGEIYDFDIGDEFHYRNIFYEGSQYPPDLKYDECVNITITDKYYSADRDTVFYNRTYRSSRIENNGTWDTSMVDLVSFKNLGSTLRDVHGKWAFPDSSNPDYFHGRVLNEVAMPNAGNDGYTNMRFVQGLGQVNYHYDQSGQQHMLIEEKLVYYKKGSEVWGTPYPVSIEKYLIPDKRLVITPNPAHNEIEVSIGKYLKSELIIYDMNSKKVLNFEFAGNTTKLDISNLKTGIYILTVVNKDGVSNAKLLVF